MRKRELIKNVGSSWFALAVNILVGIFLSPFILHRLGAMAYGAWILVFSVTGYYGLFDLGIRSSIIRYVATYNANGDLEGVSKLINTALAVYTAIGVIAFFATIGFRAYLGVLFRMPPSFLPTARVLFLLVGTSVALGFPAGVFTGILEGLNRFYFVNVTNLVSTILRALFIVLALHRGYGILSVAAITIVLPLIGSFARAILALRVLPVRFGWKYINYKAFGEIARYSGVSFILMIAYKLRFKTDEVVVSTMLSVTAVTYFSIGDRLVDYTGEVVSSLAQIFVPMSGHSEAKGNKDDLRRILIAGNRACALIVFPITATLLILGKSVISAWVGSNFVARCYPVMVALLIPSTFALAQAASPRILYGMARHRSLAWVTGMEAVANLILSIVLIRPFGIVGDALGTAIPLSCTSLFFMPRHLCRVLNVSVRTYLRQAYTLPLMLVMPSVLVLLLMKRWFFARTYAQVFMQIAIAMIPYAAGLAWAFSKGKMWKVEGFSGGNEMEKLETTFFEAPAERP